MEGFVLWGSYFCWRGPRGGRGLGGGGGGRSDRGVCIHVCVYGEGGEGGTELELYALYALSMNRRDVVV